MSSEPQVLGTFTPFDSLSPEDRKLVEGTWNAAKNAVVPLSKFPVGAMLVAENDAGEQRVFAGCNVENRFMPATICAERTAIVSAVAAGFTKGRKLALVLEKYQGPGASPCGVCRQVITQFACDAVILNVADKNNNVRVFHGYDLLPAAKGEAVPFERLNSEARRAVKRLTELQGRSYVPYSKQPRAALFFAANSKDSKRRRSFVGLSDDNASYGASALAECVAMRSARAAGYIYNATLVVTVDDVKAHNPIEGECLQVLREFGPDPIILMVGADRSVLRTSLDELLPESFGPSCLA